MRFKPGFDTVKYLTVQKQAIQDRLSHFSGRLYLEFGGKLLSDFHATRTLPGYLPDAKLTLLKSLKKDLGIIYCVSAKQLSAGKIRGDLGISYDIDTFRALEVFKTHQLPVLGVVINRYQEETETKILARRLKNLNIPVYFRREIANYPKNLKLILSPHGFGADDYIKTDKPLVVVWGAGPGSGKLSTCLSQIYLDAQHGINSGYAKFETFPVWDLPLDHPVNIAYEAATADLGDYNCIDSFHLRAYKKSVVNYNRDIEAFPIIRTIFNKILHRDNFSRTYRSPTDMGFNVLSQGIIDHDIVSQAAKREVNFYLFRYRQEVKKGLLEKTVLDRMDQLLSRVGIDENFLPTVIPARQARHQAQSQPGKGENGVFCGAAIELKTGQIITGKNSPLLHAEASTILNAIKFLAKIPDNVKLISPLVIKRINHLKDRIGESSRSLNCAEALLALAASTQPDSIADLAQKSLPKLKGCFMHTTHQLSSADDSIFRKLGIWVSTDGLIG
ncbi:MAG TPA: DUF1846 family protein [Candidatus Woesebacteria bacterium]|jgi:uncharacterized protein (UPF0371 family)|nr:DUF1846 family protein [Candidatus Shapirobacteria bacterium]HOR01744.1 DUF1846 family protein [Candidatus Woesebacteria bacterium]